MDLNCVSDFVFCLCSITFMTLCTPESVLTRALLLRCEIFSVIVRMFEIHLRDPDISLSFCPVKVQSTVVIVLSCCPA